MRITESQLRQIVREEITDMAASPAPDVDGALDATTAYVFAGPEGAEIEFPPDIDAMSAAVAAREQFEDLFAMAEMPGDYGRAMKAGARILARLGITHVAFQTGDDSADSAPVPLAAAGRALTAIVRRAQRDY